jgi:hypothetical protein
LWVSEWDISVYVGRWAQPVPGVIVWSRPKGMKLGRPVGGVKNLKLDKHAAKIDDYLTKGINKVAISKLLDVSPNTLYEWPKVRRHNVSPETSTNLKNPSHHEKS